MDISPIKNQRDYRKVLKAIEGLNEGRYARWLPLSLCDDARAHFG